MECMARDRATSRAGSQAAGPGTMKIVWNPLKDVCACRFDGSFIVAPSTTNE
jgi:hypothetical protein